MTAHRILSIDHADLVPASNAGREKLARRESVPKNTISSTDMIKLIEAQTVPSESLEASLLRDIASCLSRK